MRPEIVLAMLVAGALACVLWPILLLAVGSSAPVGGWALVAHLTGMGAGYGVIVLILLMSRTPVLERGVGADRLARWHAAGGRIVISLVLVHAVTAVGAWAQARGLDPAVAFWQVLRMPWMISATIGTVLLVGVAVLSARAARRRISFERWHAAHLVTYVAVALGFVHQLAGPDLAGHRIAQLAWALLYLQTFGLVLRHRVLVPLRDAGRRRMRVTAVVPEGADTVSLIVEGRHLDELEAQAGQFFRWRFLTPDSWWTAHPFSLSAPPSATHLRLTVKSLGDGSRFLQNLEAGTWVVAEGPYGAMTAARRTRRNVLLVAGGIGITPMRALFETLPVEPGADVLLLYRVRAATGAVFASELDLLARRHGFRVMYLDERAGPFSAGLFRFLVPDLPDRDVFLCGPPGMATAVRRAVRAAGLPRSQLHHERFLV